jgi:hypothetical protein
VKPYLKKYYLEWNSSDVKPTGRTSRSIQKSFRQKNKKEIMDLEEPKESPEGDLSEEIMAIQAFI